MEIRRASPGDYAGIIELQAANFLANLTVEEREGGFLSAQFTLSQIVAMADDLGILVARDGNRMAGYLCAHRADLAPLPPVVEATAYLMTMEALTDAARHGAASTVTVTANMGDDQLHLQVSEDGTAERRPDQEAA